MTARLATASALLLFLQWPASAHRLDEYLQASILSIEKHRIQASMRLIPGVAVSSAVLALIDTDRDGAISQAEQLAYAKRVLHDLSISVDGQVLAPQLISVNVPPLEELKEGLGEIHIEFAASPIAGGSHRRLVFENHHQPAISVYLMNCLVPQDARIGIVAQKRNENQSFYELDFVQTTAGTASSSARSVGFASIFRLGMRHIAEGSDHLLFLLALLLPAPLIALRSRWAGLDGVRPSLLRILKVVTAFTLGHSLTLALAALGVVRVPARPVEVLIAVSVFVSAVHALRPLFPGREARLAAFFGLIHGLAFATTLADLGLVRWQRVWSILAFNLGIETMQLIAVAAVMPALLLLSRTPTYSFLRIGGALFAGFTSLAWITERWLNLHL